VVVSRGPPNGLLTTNRADVLEPALAARPGRVDQATLGPIAKPFAALQHPEQHCVVILVLATTEDELPGARARLRELGVTAAAVVAPSDARRLLLAPVDDESEATSLVARLRAGGQLAVLRPDGGPQLEAWTRHTRPIAIGERLSLCFAWSEHDRRGLSNMVEFDPGGGFGTGQHPSTRLLLEELAARITGGERVLDVGCGSGVLGLCALRLGASSALGVDIEANAIEATRRNAALNGFERVEVRLDPLGSIKGAFDVVVANIGWATLVELAPELIEHVSPSGWLAVSGISPAHCSLVAASLRPLQVLECRTCDEWSALVLVPRPFGAAWDIQAMYQHVD
jgi:ribosomal protein L11 methyltransferase